MNHMKTKLILLSIISSLLPAPVLLAQENLATNVSKNFGNNFSTNLSTSTSAITNTQTRKDPGAVEGEQLLLPPGLKEKLKLTDTQKAELKPIEDDFANTGQEYQAANQPRIDAANEANRQARAAKDNAQIQAARTQLQQVWAGLQSYRVAAVARIKLLLTPDQLKVLDDPKNQWREVHAAEAKVSSVK
jgi:Spy/CpxP family protein refolding chaperone